MPGALSPPRPRSGAQRVSVAASRNATRQYRYSNVNGRSSSPTRTRGRPRHAAARQAIVDATVALLAERGFRAMTMDAIAARAGVGKNTIYRRWNSKEELVTDALAELTAPHLDASEGADAYARLLDRADNTARTFADPVVGRILPDLLGELQRNSAFAVVFAERILKPRRQAVVDDIRREMERGDLRPDLDPDQVADLLVGPQLLRHLLPYEGAPAAAGYPATELLDTIWNGIGQTRRTS
jgi:AcrR family transcriptional regulator